MDTKKILSLLLSIALVFTLMPIGNASFAQQTGAATTIAVTAESQSAIASLSGDKITFVTKEKDAAASEELEVTIANNGRAETQSLTIKLDDAAKNAFELVAVDTETTVALDGLTADTIANGASKKFKIKTKALSEAKEHTGKLTIEGAGIDKKTIELSYLVVDPDTITATVSSETVQGTKGAEITAKEFTITLVNDTFTALAQSNAVTTWFESIPQGLVATVKSVSGSTLTVTISGTPSEAKTADIVIQIPADKMTIRSTELAVTPNTSAKYEIGKADQNAPSVVTGEAPTVEGGKGKLKNVTDKMEYKLQSASDYTQIVSATEVEVIPGTYDVRFAGDSNHNPSLAQVVTVPQYSAPQTPSAVVTVDGEELSIQALVRTQMKPTELKITLQNATFKEITEQTDVSSWFTNKVNGLAYKTKAAVNRGDTEVIVVISGIPQNTSSEQMGITIASQVLTTNSQIEIKKTEKVKYAVSSLIFSKGSEKPSFIGTVGTALSSNLNIVVTTSIPFDPAMVSEQQCLEWFPQEVRVTGLKVRSILRPSLSTQPDKSANRTLLIYFEGIPTSTLKQGCYAITIPANAFMGGYVTTAYTTTEEEKVPMGIAAGIASADDDQDLLIDGSVMLPLEEKVVKITLQEAKFVQIANGVDVKEWFGSALGLSYKIKGEVTDGATVAKVAITDTPNALSAEKVAITIPNVQLKDRNVDIAIQPSDKVKFNITSPEATIKDVQIDGREGKESVPQDVEITLKNAQFENLVVGESVKAWFGQFFPRDMEAKVKSFEPQKLVITISGTPGGVAYPVPITINIPGNKLKGNIQNLEVTHNRNAIFMILEKDSPSPSPENNNISQNSGSTSAYVEPKVDVKKDGDSTVAEISANTPHFGKRVNASVGAQSIEKALKAAEELAKQPKNAGTKPSLEIKVNTSKNAEAASLSLSQSAVETVAKSKAETLTVKSGVGAVTLDKKAVESVAKNTRGSVALNVEKAESKLNEAQKKAVGDAPVYDITIVSSGTQLRSFDGGLITVEIPYTLQKGQSPAGVVV